ncbi:hypothetical protein D623_10015733 [Myotis brandtii]|uniref:Uncharacterized protein n=1 Tax=Myotis brandtii TaxID=109478 RepID=S7NYK2_MYOBR|nr:hypothetical protein D623_10015733 [Myotis brandtii]
MGEIQDTCSDIEPLQPPLGGYGGPSHLEGQGQRARPAFNPWGLTGPEIGREELGLSTYPRDGAGAVQEEAPYSRSAVRHRGPGLREQECRGTLVGPVRTPEADTRKRVLGEEIGDRTLTTSVHLWHSWADGKRLT